MIDTSGLNFIYFLHQFRTPFLDGVIRSLNFFDRQEFFFLFIPIVWLCYRWQLGRKIFYLFLISPLTNLALKALFVKPRPFQIDPSLGLIDVQGFSFPSGAAQSAVLIAGLLLYHFKGSWKWPLAIGFFLCLSFSRIYLGVHFPIDILGGWVVGSFLFVVYAVVFPRLERATKSCSPLTILLWSQSLFSILIITFPSVSVLLMLASASGVELGIFLNKRFFTFAPPPSNHLEFWLRALLGPAAVFALYALFSLLPFSHSKAGLFILFFLTGFWMSAVANALCNKFSAKKIDFTQVGS